MTFVRESVPVVDRLKASLAVGEAIHPEDAQDAVDALEKSPFVGVEVRVPGRDEWIDLGQAAIAGYVRDRGHPMIDADTERQVIDYLRDNGQRSTHEVADFMQVPADRAGLILGRLARRGALQRVQRVKGASSWRLP